MGKEQIKTFLKGVLAGLIVFGIIVLIIRNKPIEHDYEPYNSEIIRLQRDIDSLEAFLPDDSVIIRYEKRIDTIYKERDEKIDSIINLSDGGKLEFFTKWLSEMDSL
jgi:hypothetical protein